MDVLAGASSLFKRRPLKTRLCGPWWLPGGFLVASWWTPGEDMSPDVVALQVACVLGWVYLQLWVSVVTGTGTRGLSVLENVSFAAPVGPVAATV